ncbi:MAG: acyltransferase [Clostridiales Family XIII bacterium]|jgi:peptidoglycan/LPS O-acetylase OafA/YrhL|nr:acyltransferase [Clostridiales Family XIII bacterium]
MGRSFGQITEAHSAGAGGLKWLNSLRALGVILVLVYHFFPSFLPGGFIGVDVFFVVSGYLITSLLVREFERSGRLRLFDFFRRRWLRLFPAIAAMLLVSLPLSLLIPSDFRTDIARQAAASLSWSTNYYEIFTGQSYEARLLPHLFIHTWTLSVEMHYYLFWGAVAAVVLFAASRVRRRGGASACSDPRAAGGNRAAARVALLPMAVVFAAVSVACMRSVAARASDPSAAYMSTLSHIFPLMIGSAFGCLYGFSPLISYGRLFVKKNGAAARVFRPVSLAAAAAGVAAIVFLSFGFSFRDPRVYEYGILAVSLITAALLCLARMWQDLSPRREPGVTDYLGLRSYSIYLLHWPVMIVVGRLAGRLGASPDASSLWCAALGIPATFIAAELSYRWVEQPFRARRGPAYAAYAAYAPGVAVKGAGAGKRLWNVIPVCVAAALIAVSLNAVATAPRLSDIESGLRYGAMSLDVSNLKGLYSDVGSAASTASAASAADGSMEKRASKDAGASPREGGVATPGEGGGNG